MPYSTMIVNKARGKKSSRGNVRVRGRKKARNHSPKESTVLVRIDGVRTKDAVDAALGYNPQDYYRIGTRPFLKTRTKKGFVRRKTVHIFVAPSELEKIGHMKGVRVVRGANPDEWTFRAPSEYDGVARNRGLMKKKTARRKSGTKRAPRRNHFDSTGEHDSRGWSMIPPPPPLSLAEKEIIIDLPGRRKSGCRLDSKAVSEIIHPLTSAPLLDIINMLVSKGLVEKSGGCFRLTVDGEKIAQNINYEAGHGPIDHGKLLKLADAYERSRSRGRKKRNSGTTRWSAYGMSRQAVARFPTARNITRVKPGLYELDVDSDTDLVFWAGELKFSGTLCNLRKKRCYIVKAGRDGYEERTLAHVQKTRNQHHGHIDHVQVRRGMTFAARNAGSRMPKGAEAKIHDRNDVLDGRAVEIVKPDARGAVVYVLHTGDEIWRSWGKLRAVRGGTSLTRRNSARPKYVLVVDVDGGDSWSAPFGAFLRDNKDSPDIDEWKALRVGQTIGVGGGAAPRFEVTGLAQKPKKTRNKKKAVKRKSNKKKSVRRNAPKKKAKKNATKRAAPKKKVARKAKRRVVTTTTVTKRVMLERNKAALRNFYNLRESLD